MSASRSGARRSISSSVRCHALDVDLGRRRRRHDEAARLDADACRVAGVERPVAVEVET